MEYNLLEPWKTLDPWQEKYINCDKDCFVLCGRQSGKTAAASIKFGKRAAENKNRTILMVAYTEKQAYNLFFKTLMYLEAQYPRLIAKKAKKPTKHEINLKNGSKIMCYAAGLDGSGIRTFTVTDLVIDEAAPMAREVFVSTMPMLAVTGGTMDIISTPRGKEGFFYECSKDDKFEKFYISAEDCPRHKKEFLESQKEKMSEIEYAQEYLARFMDEIKRFFSEEWIKSVCTQERRETILKDRDYFLGCDISAMGKDETTFEIIDGTDRENLIQIENITTTRQLTTQTTKKILDLNRLYNFNKIGVDDAGVGFGVFSELLEAEETRKKVEAINNASRPLDDDPEHPQRKKILKEDLYWNLRTLGEKGKIKLLKDDELLLSLASVQHENIIKSGEKTKYRIFGNYTHIVEGINRSVWVAKNKHLNIYFA